MSFTFHFLDQRRTGVKLPYVLPPRRYVEGVGHEWTNPFAYDADPDGDGPQPPPFLAGDPEPDGGGGGNATLAADLSARRLACLQGLHARRGCRAEILAYYHMLLRARVAAERCRPDENVDASLPHFEQDLQAEACERHLLFESCVEAERVRLLYNAGLHAAREANHLRLADAAGCGALFEEAAGLFELLASASLPAGDVPNELCPDFLRVLALFCLGGAAENELLRRRAGGRGAWEACTHLCFSLNHYYARAHDLLKGAKVRMSPAAGVACHGFAVNYAAVKQGFFLGLAHDFYALQPEGRKVLGRLRKAVRNYEASLSQLSKMLPGVRTNVETEVEHLLANARLKVAEATRLHAAINDAVATPVAPPVVAAASAAPAASGSSSVGAGEEDLLQAYHASAILYTPPYHRPCEGGETDDAPAAAAAAAAAAACAGSQSPAQAPVVPEWVPEEDRLTRAERELLAAEASADADGGAAARYGSTDAFAADIAAAVVPAAAAVDCEIEAAAAAADPSLELEMIVPCADLYLKQLDQRTDSEGRASLRYHSLDVVAKVAVSAQGRRRSAEKGFALVLLLDCWAPVDDEAASSPAKAAKAAAAATAGVREAAALLLRVAGLGERDGVCVVGHSDGAMRCSPLLSCGPEGQDQVARRIAALSPAGNHAGSAGSSVVAGLEAAMGVLGEDGGSSRFSSCDVVVFSDGFDSTARTHYDNWCGLHRLYAAHAAAEARRGQPVCTHTFALGGAADAYLLRAVAGRMGGDHVVAEAGHNGLGRLRAWFLRLLADKREKVAGGCTLSVACEPGVTVKQVGRYDLCFDPTYEHNHAADGVAQTLRLSDFSVGNESNVLLTLGVPEHMARYDPSALATVRVCYRDAVSGRAEEVAGTVRIGASERVLTRAAFAWLPQMYCTAVAGVALLSGAGAGSQPVAAGDLVDTVDALETRSGSRVHTALADGTRFTFAERTSAVFAAMDGAELTSAVTLKKGAVFVMTGQGAVCSVKVLDGMHVVAVEPHSHVKVHIDAKTSLVSVNCMHGHAHIATVRAGAASRMELLSLRQTQMGTAIGPITPWTLEEAGYREWLSDEACCDGFLQTTLLVGVHICRSVCAEWIAKSVGWLRKGAHRRVTETKANRRCREFLTRFWLRESKHFLTNSMSGLAPATEHIRRDVDESIRVALGGGAVDLHALFQLGTVARALAEERGRGGAPGGGCGFYDTPLQRRLEARGADEKAREERDRAQAEQRRRQQQRSHEASRRVSVLRALFPLADTHGVGAVFYATLRQVAMAVEEIADPNLAELKEGVTARWSTLTSANAKNRRKRRVASGAAAASEHDAAGGLAFDEEDFVRLWLSLVGECGAAYFNTFVEHLHGILEELCLLNEGSRRSRAVFALFRRWDSDGNGSIALSELETALQCTHQHDGLLHLNLDNMRRGLAVPPPQPVTIADDRNDAVSVRDTAAAAAAASAAAAKLEEDGAADAVQPSAAAVESCTTPSHVLAQALEKEAPSLGEGFPVTLRRLHYGLAAFFLDYTERAYHTSVESLARHVKSRRQSHNSIMRVVQSLQREKEYLHLQQWDLRHVFDGITSKVREDETTDSCSKNIKKRKITNNNQPTTLPQKLHQLAQMPAREAPEYVQTAAAPICILCGLTVYKKVHPPTYIPAHIHTPPLAHTVLPTFPHTHTQTFETQFDDGHDYWAVLRGKLLKDADGFIDFLRNFPPMSVTYRQVLRAMCFLDSPDFDSCRLLSLSPPLSQLCDWVKITLKILFLEHGWDLSNRVDVLQRRAPLLHAAATALPQPLSLPAASPTPTPHDDESNEDPAAIAAAAADETTSAAAVPAADDLSALQLAAACPGLLMEHVALDKPHTKVKLNRSFEGIVEPTDPASRVSSRFSTYTDASDVCRYRPDAGDGAAPADDTRVLLPDRRLQTPLLRTVPVASVTCADGLPPHYIPRLDYDCRADAICTERHKEAHRLAKAGRTPGPPHARSAGGTASSLGHYRTGAGAVRSGSTPRPHPPRPLSAPVGGNKAASASAAAAATPCYSAADTPSTHGYTPTPPCTPQLAFASSDGLGRPPSTEVTRFLADNGLSELACAMAVQVWMAAIARLQSE